MEILANIFALGLLIAVVLLLTALIKPGLSLHKKLLKTSSRGRLLGYYACISLALFLGIGITAPRENLQQTQPQTESSSQKALRQVVKVIDGDTIDVDIDGKTERLRLIGIDTPETVDPRKPVQCFGKEASNKTKELLEGEQVRLEADHSQGSRDKYDRLLRYVFLEDGTNFNKLMISEGYAYEYTYDLPYEYQSEFRQAQKEAKDDERGLWSSSTCNGSTESTKQSTDDQTDSATPAQPEPDQNQNENGNCDPNYTPCVPKVSYDLNCSDIAFSVEVIGTDIHGFDRDGDKIGCESN